MNKVRIREKFDRSKFLLHITKCFIENVTIHILLFEFSSIIFPVNFNFHLGHISDSFCLVLALGYHGKLTSEYNELNFFVTAYILLRET